MARLTLSKDTTPINKLYLICLIPTKTKKLQHSNYCISRKTCKWSQSPHLTLEAYLQTAPLKRYGDLKI